MEKNIKVIVILLLINNFLSCINKSENTTINTNEKPLLHNDLIKNLSQKIALDSNSATLYYARAQAYLKDTLIKPAVADLRQAIALDSMNTAYRLQLSDVYFNTGEIIFAIEEGKIAHRINKNDINTKNKLAKYYMLTKGYDNALLLCNESHMLDPTNADAYFIEAMVYADKNEDKKCIDVLLKCTAQDPTYSEAYMKIATIYNRKKDVQAIKYYDYVLKIDSNNLLAMYGKAMYYQNNNRIKQAIEIYNNMILKDKNYTDAYYNLGYIYFDTDSIAKAQRHFEMATKTNPTHAPSYYMIGVCFEALKRYVEALVAYKQSLVFDDKNTLTKTAIGRMESAVTQ